MSGAAAKRLVTRGDLDGLACAVIFTEAENIGSIELIHPQDITDRVVEISDRDILANLPYHPDCGMWFDHHLLTKSNTTPPEDFVGRYEHSPSAARLVYEYYREQDESLSRFEHLIRATDRLDSATLVPQDVTDPRDYILLGYTIDNRSGLGSGFKDYFMKLLRMLKTHTIQQIMEDPDVAERTEKLRESEDAFRDVLQRTTRVDGNVAITDLREEAEDPVGNRFLIYTLFPDTNVSLRIHWGPRKESVIAAVGHNIFNRGCGTSAGELMSEYGGGGHRGAGTCKIPVGKADEVLDKIVQTLKQNG